MINKHRKNYYLNYYIIFVLVLHYKNYYILCWYYIIIIQHTLSKTNLKLLLLKINEPKNIRMNKKKFLMRLK